ncbi:MAG: PEP-CTERM sorting domain-containing protein [Verrucomicrobia bacterium]|nr:PEP-CTERM sorting domain-containing protein [Verrucomicrobiota bacterium]
MSAPAHRLLGALLAAALGPAAPAQTTLLTGQLLTNPGAEAGSLLGWTQTGVAGHLADDGSYEAGYATGYTPHSGTYQFVAGANAGASGTLAQTVSFASFSAPVLALLDEGGVLANVSLWQQSLYQGGTTDYVQVRLDFHSANNQPLGSYTSAPLNAELWQNFSASYAVPAGSRSVTYSVISVRGNNGGQWIDAFNDDHSLTLSAIPEPGTYAALAGAAALGAAVWRRRRRRGATGPA